MCDTLASTIGNSISSYFTISKSHFINYIIQFYNTPNIPTFYFPILLIKIIFLHNKIIYLTITIIYNTTHYLFSLSFFLFKKPQSPQPLHCTHLTPPPPPPVTHNILSTPKKKKKNTATHGQKTDPRRCTYCPSRCTTRPTLLHPLTMPLPTKITPIEINPPT